MSDNRPPLSADEARALLSEHLEGFLDEETAAEVGEALARDPTLRAEASALHATLAALRRQDRPEAPSDMLAKVRARLTEERRQELGAGREPSATPPFPEPPPRSRQARFVVEGLVALAAVLAVVIGVTLGQGAGQRASDLSSHTAQAAGIAGGAERATAELVAPGLDKERVASLAKASGMRAVAGEPLTFEGDRKAAARFSVALRVELARQGGSLVGLVPDAPHVRTVVRTRR